MCNNASMKKQSYAALEREQSAQQARIHAMLSATEWTITLLAKNADLAHTTVSRFLNSENATHCLSARTMLKLENAVHEELVTKYGPYSDSWPMAVVAEFGADLPANARTLMHPPGKQNVPLAEFTRAPDVPVPVPSQHPRNLPVRGTAVGGDEGDFIFNGEEVDYVSRLPSLSGVKEAFALYITGDSMFPRFEHGDTAIVHPGRPLEPGKDVIVELHGQDGEPGPCFLKRLVRRSGGKVILRQFNPDGEIDIDSKRVKAIFRVLNLSELL